MKRTLITQAPAKINIGLWVKGKRADGYHELASLMQTISLSDTIAIKETREDGLRIECDHPAVPTGPENLVYKSAMLLLQRLEIAPRLLIQIEKRIPVAAGLAGGSTDAAAVMVALACVASPCRIDGNEPGHRIGRPFRHAWRACPGDGTW